MGCSDLVSPSEGAWLRRDGDDVIVGCYTSRQSWQLRCVDGVWTGTVGLCPQHHYRSHTDQHRPYDADFVIGKSHATTCNLSLSSYISFGIICVSFWHCSRSIRQGVCNVTVSISLRPSVCLIRSLLQPAAGFLLWALQTGDVDRLSLGASAIGAAAFQCISASAAAQRSSYQ